MKTYSANQLAEMLEKDRGTIVRSLRNVSPDAETTKGRPTWKLATAARALEKHNRAQDGGSGNSGAAVANPPEYAAYDRAFDKLEALPTLPARRKAAIAIMPMLHGMIAALRKQGHEVSQHPEHVELRGDRVYQLMMLGFQGPCEWTHDQVWANLNHVGVPTDDAD
jgi:hypothetical protein